MIFNAISCVTYFLKFLEGVGSRRRRRRAWVSYKKRWIDKFLIFYRKPPLK